MAAAPPKLSLLLSLITTIYIFLSCTTITPVFSAGKPGPFACDVSKNPDLESFTFCNPSLDIETRVADLVNKLTLKEKIGWVISGSEGVSRLGIPGYWWWSEALHGIGSNGPGSKFEPDNVRAATSFPQVILTAASFNVSLFHLIGKAISTEARAMHNVGAAGLTFWSPNVNIFRDPRWGRGQETPGEDPLLSSQYAVAYVKALQQRDDGDQTRLKVAACCKHYTAYDLEHWKEFDRFTFDAQVTQQDLDDTYQPPFKSCVLDGNVASVMCSYNQVNGKPSCGNPELLNGVVRGQWKLNGYIVSDCDSVEVLFNHQHYKNSPEEAAAVAVNSGLDLDCGSFLLEHVEAAVSRGLINETSINRAVTNNFATLMRLGFFDGNPTNQLYGNLGLNDICTKENQELAREAALQGIVLLKNLGNSLPLSPTSVKSLAVIGPNADDKDFNMLGSYFGNPCEYTTPLKGLTAYVPTVYHSGCNRILCDVAQVDEAKKIASTVDAVVLVVGSNQTIETEGLDRENITLPGQQQLLISEVAKVAKGPVILVIMSGGGMDVQFAKENPKITGILWAGFPGEAGGTAIADVIFGSHNPSGRLPLTWYPQSYAEKVNMTDMNMRPNPTTGYPGRTYRFYIGPTVYPFGYGLSYSEFKHLLAEPLPTIMTVDLEEGHACQSSDCKSVDAVEPMCKNLGFGVHLTVKNVGKLTGSHTVLVFSRPPRVHNAPRKQLVAFRKVHLRPKGEEVVRFEIDVCKDLSVVDELGNRKVALGKHVLHVGNLKHSFNVTI
ncbi:hypothetical protein ABFS82_02G062300 [Erythranthe guttata]|uniref:Fibronectin type III-like domain-containing protein n=1 Tax=Erythranthe guttata TaxID=4155 RepID=A0A022PSN5_ERYGU|nr:PREDICTED: beta-xylosidase/alpha-L-arabinofuranosidase 2-like [Erythranthe guttata]EYU18509.1 hypothetical protein MIMGU_mgv1a001665mg [Erythranthe guttata]|eukprot:XP_012828483.1 PREDICTED: beta-xylosidase/alpha-L-arabinofuranosidase 2-like [Erythranthe guttata]